TGVDDAAARIEDRPLGRRHQLDRCLDRLQVALQLRRVALVDHGLAGWGVGAGRELDILRDVDHDRTGTTGLGDAEGFMDNPGKLVDVLDEPVVLGARPRDADRVAFLEGVGADQRRWNLTRDAYERD